MRSLAQRSSQAAKDIKDLITNSNGQVKDGVELVNRAGTALTEIVNSIKKVASLVSDIATASMEQSTGIEQINRALTQMDEVTQQNSALVEENAATAKTLEQQSADDECGSQRLQDRRRRCSRRARDPETAARGPNKIRRAGKGSQARRGSTTPRLGGPDANRAGDRLPGPRVEGFLEPVTNRPAARKSGGPVAHNKQP